MASGKHVSAIFICAILYWKIFDMIYFYFEHLSANKHIYLIVSCR